MARELTRDPAIRCVGLTRDFGGGRGVFDLDLEVPRGVVFGFLGPNAAGKTTVARLLMGFLRADRGAATVLGLDAWADAKAIKREVGYLPGELAHFPGLTAGGVLGLLGGLRGGVDPRRVEALAARLGLELSQRYEALSHGTKQKVALVQAFMHAPRLLILDEPTNGLDPLVQREFRALVREVVEGGATVFLSSHVLSEVEQLCDRVALLREGRLIRASTLEELRAARTHLLDLRVSGAVDAAAVERVPGVSQVVCEDHRVRCALKGSIAPLLAALTPAGIEELDSRELTLEELFFAELQPPGGADARA